MRTYQYGPKSSIGFYNQFKSGLIVPSGSLGSSVSGGGGGVTFHEPEGFTQATHITMPATMKTTGVDGWAAFTESSCVFETDETAPLSPTDVMKCIYKVGLKSGNTPFAHSHPIPTVSQIYVRYAVKFSSNYLGDTSFVNKHMFIWTNESSVGDAPSIILNHRCSGAGTMRPEVRTQTVDNHFQDLACNTVNSPTMLRNQWHIVEHLLQIVTKGGDDNIWKCWLNSNLVADRADGHFCASDTNGFGLEVQYAPYWGGNTGATVQEEQYHWSDDIYVSTKP